MKLENVDFKMRTGTFALSSGSLGNSEKQLILDSLNVWMLKQNSAIQREPNNSELSRQHSRFTRAIYTFTTLRILNNDDEFASLLLTDDEANKVTYNDLADAMTAINDQIRVLEEDGTYLTTNVSMYSELKRLLSEFNEQKTKLVRVPSKPFGLKGRKK